jgi:hypothetical protein
MNDLLPLLAPDPRFREIAFRATELGSQVAQGIYRRIPAVRSTADLDRIMIRDVRTTFLNRSTYLCVGLTLARGALTDFLGRPDRHGEVWAKVGMDPPTEYSTMRVAGCFRALLAWGWLFNWIPDYELSLRTLARALGIESAEPKKSGSGLNHQSLFKVAQKLVEQSDLTKTKAPTGRSHSTEFLDHIDLLGKIRGTVHNYGLHAPFDDVNAPPDEVTWDGRRWTFGRGKPLSLSLADGATVFQGAVENWGRLVLGEPVRSHLAEIADYRCEEDNPLFPTTPPAQ